MAKQIRKRKCKNCKVFFPPDPHNAWHQEYCTKPECRKAGKAASRKKWLAKEENQDHFRGPDNVQRVREWRGNNPGYSRRTPTAEQKPLQDLVLEKSEQNPPLEIPKPSLPKEPSQDLVLAQQAVLIGLIAHLTGDALQDHVAMTALRLQQLGTDILNGPNQTIGGSDDSKASRLSTAYPEGPRSVQLAGSPTGP